MNANVAELNERLFSIQNLNEKFKNNQLALLKSINIYQTNINIV